MLSRCKPQGEECSLHSFPRLRFTQNSSYSLPILLPSGASTSLGHLFLQDTYFSSFEFLPHNLPSMQLFLNSCPPPGPDPVVPHPPTDPSSPVLRAHQFLPFPDFFSTPFHQDLLHLTATASIQSLLINTFVPQLLAVAHQRHLPPPHFILS